MSGYPPKGCKAPRCTGHAVSRGYCTEHAPTEAQRGYGSDWRQVRARVRQQETSCRECASMLDLTVDHIRPQSLGGTNARANLRVLCRSCHASIGRKATSR